MKFSFGNVVHARVVEIDEEKKTIAVTKKNGDPVLFFSLDDLGGIQYKAPGLANGTLKFCENFEDSLAAPSMVDYDVLVVGKQKRDAEVLFEWFEANRTKEIAGYIDFIDTGWTRAAYDGKQVILWHQSLLGRLEKGGLQGEKRLRLSSILSIQFRRATPLALGFLQFETAGGSQSSARGGSVEAFADENTIKFGENDNEAVNKFRDAVESGLSDGNKPVGSDSIADELKKFAELRDQGILTDEEFGQKKRELLEK